MSVGTAKQGTRELTIATPLGDDVLLLRDLEGHEELSRLFEYQLTLLTDGIELTREQSISLLGKNVTFTVELTDGSTRYFNGYVSNFQFEGREIHDGDDKHVFYIYTATIVPWFWLLTNTHDCRIFQKKSVPEVVEQIFTDLGFNDFDLSGLTQTYKPMEYCVQYRESDFAFVSRLLEEEGIFYFFRHENGKHTMVLADSPATWFELDDAVVQFVGSEERAGGEITEWTHEHAFRPGSWAQTDYNFKKPFKRLNTSTESELPIPNKQAYEVFDYPGRYRKKSTGNRRTTVRMETEEAQYETIEGTCTYRSFTTGGFFRIGAHHRSAEVGNEYTVKRVQHSASVGGSYSTSDTTEGFHFETKFQCIPRNVTFHPERITPLPVVDGPQTATVVGPRGEEIHTDKYGRVKVQFHWDREGSRNENSSCWMRTSQVHAGNGWGSIDLPRISEEVIVSFLDGDPDRPIIKGRVYNGKAMPPFGLPGAMTRSGMMTDTHKGSGYNEMTMDDTAGQEQLRVNAQKDMDTTVGNDQTLAVGVDRTDDIGNDDALTIGVDSTTEIGNDRAETVGNNENIDVANNIVIEAGTSITLACGASTIHMNQGGVVTISGQYVSSLAAATNSIVAPMTEVAGATMLNQAGLICLDVSGIKHIKGNQTSVEGATVDIDGGITVIKGAPIKIGEAGAPLATIPAPGQGGGGGGPGGPKGPKSASSSSDGAYASPDATDDTNDLVDPAQAKTEKQELADHPEGGKLIQKGKGEKVIVLVGGGGDANTGNVRDGLSQTVKEKNPDADIVYVGWEGDEEAAEWLEQYKEEHPDANVELIGHSYGGDTAMQIAKELNGKVDDIHVITLDPVAHWKTGRPPNVSRWDNIYVSGVNDHTDIIAGIGGHWGHESKADSNMKAPDGMPHRDSVGMYDYIRPSPGELLQNPRKSTDLPPAIMVPQQMDQQMDRMMQMSNQGPVDRETGERNEFGAAIGMDGRGKLQFGPPQDLGPNNSKGFDPNLCRRGQTPVGSFHTHPGDDHLTFSSPDYEGMQSGDEQVSIVQNDKDPISHRSDDRCQIHSDDRSS